MFPCNHRPFARSPISASDSCFGMEMCYLMQDIPFYKHLACQERMSRWLADVFQDQFGANWLLLSPKRPEGMKTHKAGRRKHFWDAMKINTWTLKLWRSTMRQSVTSDCFVLYSNGFKVSDTAPTEAARITEYVSVFAQNLSNLTDVWTQLSQTYFTSEASGN